MSRVVAAASSALSSVAGAGTSATIPENADDLLRSALKAFPGPETFYLLLFSFVFLLMAIGFHDWFRILQCAVWCCRRCFFFVFGSIVHDEVAFDI